MRWEQGSLQAPALAQAAQAGEADVLNCQEDLPACLPATLKIAAPLLHTTLKYTWCVCVCVYVCARPINSLPPSHCSSSPQVTASLIFYFLCDRSYNLKMQMCGLLWSLMRTSLCCVLTSIRQDYRDRGTLAFGQCHSDSTLLLECPAVTVSFITGLSLLRVWTNKPRNYNCLPAKSLIGGNNDISALLIFLACRLASAYWGTSHTYVWWDEFNLSVRNDNRGHFNVMDDICQGSVLVCFFCVFFLPTLLFL